MSLDLYGELQRTIQTLNEAKIPYASIGGLAVSLYARPRATQGIDLLIPETAWEDIRPIMAGLG